MLSKQEKTYYNQNSRSFSNYEILTQFIHYQNY